MKKKTCQVQRVKKDNKRGTVVEDLFFFGLTVVDWDDGTRTAENINELKVDNTPIL